MQINVKYFASMRERMGCAEQQVQVSESLLTVEGLWGVYLANEPLPANTLVAVNMAYCDLATRLAEGDEVAFFPPVTGG
ncbi:MAG: MoaD/ThiS family protein [Gammaproteobacteria bacterium]|nr:MoaD/ThiS family protein [Gammaproteobacteria bacterium]